MRSYPDSDRKKSRRGAVHELPRWVRIFGVVAGIAVVVFVGVHVAGGGMGHMDHGGIAGYLPGGFGHHLP